MEIPKIYAFHDYNKFILSDKSEASNLFSLLSRLTYFDLSEGYTPFMILEVNLNKSRLIKMQFPVCVTLCDLSQPTAARRSN